MLSYAGGLPDVTDFQQFLPWFLTARPSEACAKGGAGAYTDLIARQGGPGSSPESPPDGLLGQGIARSSAFRAFYTALNEQQVGLRCGHWLRMHSFASLL